MPHIIVEHSQGVSESVDIKEMNRGLHACLASQETVKLGSVKTRAIKADHAVVGDGSKKDFVHINILLLSGRSEELKQTMAKNIFNEAQAHLEKVDCLLSVNVDELGVYHK